MTSATDTPETTLSSYEENLAKLQAIVELMESNELPLEELTDKYQEGLLLLKSLNDQLNNARQKIISASELAGTDASFLDSEANFED